MPAGPLAGSHARVLRSAVLPRVPPIRDAGSGRLCRKRVCALFRRLQYHAGGADSTPFRSVFARKSASGATFPDVRRFPVPLPARNDEKRRRTGSRTTARVVRFHQSFGRKHPEIGEDASDRQQDAQSDAEDGVPVFGQVTFHRFKTFPCEGECNGRPRGPRTTEAAGHVTQARSGRIRAEDRPAAVTPRRVRPSQEDRTLEKAEKETSGRKTATGKGS